MIPIFNTLLLYATLDRNTNAITRLLNVARSSTYFSRSKESKRDEYLRLLVVGTILGQGD